MSFVRYLLLTSLVATCAPCEADEARTEQAPFLSAQSSEDTPTRLDPIEVQGRYIYPGDAALAKWRRELGCDDCIQVDHGKLPVAIAIAAAVASSIAKGLLPQPRVRGEPNDEALLLSLRDCWPDDYKCVSSYPSTALYNWAPDENQGPLDDPNAYAR